MVGPGGRRLAGLAPHGRQAPEIGQALSAARRSGARADIAALDLPIALKTPRASEDGSDRQPARGQIPVHADRSPSLGAVRL